jgi:hypothetical protein
VQNKLAFVILSILTLFLSIFVCFLLFPWSFGVIGIFSIYEMGALIGLALTISLIYFATQKYVRNQGLFPKIAVALMKSVGYISLGLVGLVCFFIVYAMTGQYSQIGYQYFQLFSLVIVSVFFLSGSYFARKKHFSWVLSSVLIGLIIGALFGISQSSIAFFIVESIFFGYTWEILTFIWAIFSIFALITTVLSKNEFNKIEKEKVS